MGNLVKFQNCTATVLGVFLSGPFTEGWKGDDLSQGTISFLELAGTSWGAFMHSAFI